MSPSSLPTFWACLPSEFMQLSTESHYPRNGRTRPRARSVSTAGTCGSMRRVTRIRGARSLRARRMIWPVCRMEIRRIFRNRSSRCGFWREVKGKRSEVSVARVVKKLVASYSIAQDIWKLRSRRSRLLYLLLHSIQSSSRLLIRQP